MNPSDIPRIALLLLPACSVSPAASVAVPQAVSIPARLPEESTPELPHPPHGEGSGELPIFVGIGASGAMTNVANAQIVTSSWDPPDQNHSAIGSFFMETDPDAKHRTVTVNSATARRPMPRARRSC